MITINVTNSNDSGTGSFRQALLNIKNNINLSYQTSITLVNSKNIDKYKIVFSKSFHIVLCDDLPEIDKNIEIFFNNSTIDGNDFYSFPSINNCNVVIYDLNMKNMMANNTSLINCINSNIIFNGIMTFSNNDDISIIESLNSSIMFMNNIFETDVNNSSYLIMANNSNITFSTKCILSYCGEKFISSTNSTIKISNSIINSSSSSFNGKNTLSILNTIFNKCNIEINCDRSLLNRSEFNECIINYSNGIHTLSDNTINNSKLSINQSPTKSSIRITNTTIDNTDMINNGCNIKIHNSNIMDCIEPNCSFTNYGIAEIINCTLGHNYHSIRNFHILNIINCTISRNNNAITIYPKSKTTIVNSILVKNESDINNIDNINVVHSLGYNLFESKMKSITENNNDIILNGGDCYLEDYNNNGGITLTMKIDKKSQAYNNGNPRINCGQYDQRNIGYERKKNINNVQYICIGAYQIQ